MEDFDDDTDNRSHIEIEISIGPSVWETWTVWKLNIGMKGIVLFLRKQWMVKLLSHVRMTDLNTFLVPFHKLQITVLYVRTALRDIEKYSTIESVVDFSI